MPALSLEGLDTELTVSLPWRVKVDLRGLDFKGLVQAIGEPAAAASSELLGWMVRAIERRGMEAQPDRWIHRGPLTRRVQVSWGTVPIRRTRVRDRTTGATYNLGDRLLHWRPYVRRSVAAVRTACELATSMSYRAAPAGDVRSVKRFAGISIAMRRCCSRMRNGSDARRSARLVLRLEGWAAGCLS